MIDALPDNLAQSDNPFWQFSLSVYGSEGVAPACLALQDKHGLDVNMLLFACWAGFCGHRFSEDELVRVCREAKAWKEAVVQPLRSVRRWIKAQDPEALPKGAMALRDGIKLQELHAEALQQHYLHALMPLMPPEPECEESTEAATPIKASPLQPLGDLFSRLWERPKTLEAKKSSAAFASANMLDYLRAEGVVGLDTTDAADLAAILRGGFPEVPPLEAVWLFE